VLAGYNTGVASFLLYGLYRGGAPAGRILAAASLTGLSLHDALCRVLAGNPDLPGLFAGFTAAAVAALLFLLLRKLAFAQPEAAGGGDGKGDVDGGSGRDGGSGQTARSAGGDEAKGMIAPKIAVVILISCLIGLSDSLVAQSVPLHTVALHTVGGAFFYPVLFYIPGQTAACLAADIKNGKYINLVTFIGAVLLTPAALLLDTPEELYRRAGLNYFFGGFFLMYIMTALISAARDSRNARLTVCLPGMLYPLFCGIGGFWGPMISASLDSFAVLAVYSAMLAALALLTFGETLVRRKEKETRTPRKEAFARYRFTERETEVLFLLIDGLSSSDIAARLFISEKTVRNHVSNMLAKTDCASRGDLLLLVKNM
jgi:DNA-binding CsgD family transcriptional regulator